jgi:hypothetical protein
MTADINKSNGALEADFSDGTLLFPSEADLSQIEELVVHVPLPSFGSTNSYINLCSDLLDASWALETLGSYADTIESKVGSG